ncbi:MAG: FtsK/SpoIIIE domain-containing protein, partial [Firmicutes bacterium]|nr:FtsK/SpoIIIE domain-containing protein [Bacillota bacterium]
ISAYPLHRRTTDFFSNEGDAMTHPNRHVMIADGVYLLVCIVCAMLAVLGIDPVTLSLISFFSLYFRFMPGVHDITRETADYMVPAISFVQKKDRISSAFGSVMNLEAGAIPLRRVGFLQRKGYATTGMYSLPPGFSFDDLISKQAELEAAVHHPLEMTRDSKRPNRVQVAILSDFPERIPYSEVVPWLDQNREKDIWLIGMGSQDVAYIRMDQYPHLLIVGRTGGGKTNTVKVLLESLLYANRAKITLGDLKGGADYRAYRERVTFAINLQDVLNAVLACQAEMVQRQAVLSQKDATFIPWVLIIDEFATISSIAANKQDKEQAAIAQAILSGVNDLLQKGRSVRIHVALIVQRPDAEAIPGTLRANIDAVVTYHVTSTVQSGVILGAGQTQAYDLPAIPGRALISRAGEYQQVQTFFVE